jgi:hypothetical protein
MPSVIWLILGIAVAGGTAFYYSDMGKKMFKKDACISDLPEPKKSEVLKAIDDKNLDKLYSFASNAENEGFDCAAKEIRLKITELSAAKDSESKCPTDEQVNVALEDIKSGKLSTDNASKLVAKLDKNGCKDQSKSINDALTEKLKPAVLSMNKEILSGMFVTQIKESLKGAPDSDITIITDIIKQSQSSGVNYSKFAYEPGKILAYADVAAKYKATKVETTLRDIAKKVSDAVAKFTTDTLKTENEKRASAEWPGIMALPDNDLGNYAKSVALCLHQTDTIKLYSGEPAVKLSQAIAGCAVNVDKVVSTIEDIKSKYGATFDEATYELNVIVNSLKKDFLV